MASKEAWKLADEWLSDDTHHDETLSLAEALDAFVAKARQDVFEATKRACYDRIYRALLEHFGEAATLTYCDQLTLADVAPEQEDGNG